MSAPNRGRAVIKFVFWTVCAAAAFGLVAYLHVSGQFAAWYYYQAKADGYAVNANAFKDATESEPMYLEIGPFDQLDGLKAREVKKGDRLPVLANGVITHDKLEEGKRVALEGGKIKVMVPWKIKEAKGFKYKDTFKHKEVATNPWGAPVNVLIVALLGICLGYMAEGFTDVLGIKVEKIRHFEGH